MGGSGYARYYLAGAPPTKTTHIGKRPGVPAETIKADNAMTSDQVNAGATLKVTATKAHPGVHQKPLATMTCEDVVGRDESFQPKAVYWAAAYGKNGQSEAETIGVEGVVMPATPAGMSGRRGHRLLPCRPAALSYH